MTASALPVELPAWIDRGMSAEAQQMRRQLGEAFDYSPSISIGEPNRAAVLALDRACRGAKTDNWDGQGALAVPPTTHRYAVSFLFALPSNVPLPEISADRDGDIVMDWDLGARSVFAVAIGRDGTLSYAGLFGHFVSRGTEMLGDVLPRAVLDGIRRAQDGQ